MPLCCRVDLDDVVADIMQKNKGIVGVDAVLVGAQHIAAMDLACHPYIRSTAQRLFEVYATVTTIPTDLGEKVPYRYPKNKTSISFLGVGSIPYVWYN